MYFNDESYYCAKQKPVQAIKLFLMYITTNYYKGFPDDSSNIKQQTQDLKFNKYFHRYLF